MSPGDPVPLLVSVANTGAGTASGVKVRAEVDLGLIHESGVQILEVAIGALAAGQSRTIPLTLTAVRAGKPAVRVTATGAGGLTADAAAAIVVSRTGPAIPNHRIAHAYVDSPGNGTCTSSVPGMRH